MTLNVLCPCGKPATYQSCRDGEDFKYTCEDHSLPAFINKQGREIRRLEEMVHQASAEVFAWRDHQGSLDCMVNTLLNIVEMHTDVVEHLAAVGVDISSIRVDLRSIRPIY